MTIDVLGLGLGFKVKRRRDYDFSPFTGPGGSGVTFPWQFQPETYGALGNGKVAIDVSTNSTATITSPTIAADPNAVGKLIMVNGANGNPGVPLLGKILSVSGSNVTTNATAGSTVSNCAAIWGTDDTAAINSALSAASTYAQANNFRAEILFADKIYMTGTLTQASSPAVINTQIQIPFPAQNGQTRKIMLTLTGSGDASALQYFESIAPNVQGSAIVSTLTAPSTPDATFLQQSVIGGPSGSSGFTGGFANTHLTINGLSVWCPAYTNIKALDMGILSGCTLDRYSSNIFAPANNLAGATIAHPYLADFPAQSLFTNSIGEGIRFPTGTNNDACYFGTIAVEGYEIGIRNAYDHLTGHRLAVLYCDVCIRADPGSTHELSITSVSAEQFNGGLRVVSGGGNLLRLDIGWDGEVSSPIFDISDTSNVCTGEFRWNDIFHATPIVTGAGGVRIINQRQGPGHVASPPAVPLTTVAATIQYRDATVVVHTGAGVTVSAITVDGTATAQTVAAASSSVPIRVPTGKTIALTYAGGTPTWDWWFD